MRHILTYEARLIPERLAASLAESRKLRGIRRVTETFSDSVRKLCISVGVAPESTSSEYFMSASIERKMHYI